MTPVGRRPDTPGTCSHELLFSIPSRQPSKLDRRRRTKDKGKRERQREKCVIICLERNKLERMVAVLFISRGSASFRVFLSALDRSTDRTMSNGVDNTRSPFSCLVARLEDVVQEIVSVISTWLGPVAVGCQKHPLSFDLLHSLPTAT